MLPRLWTGLQTPSRLSNWQIGTTSKKGNSNTKERITLLERFIKLFGKERSAYLTADRECRGHDWLRFLVSEPIPFRVRIPNNTRVPNRHRNQTVPVTRLFRLRVNEVMVLSSARRVGGIPVYLGAVRTQEELAVIIATPISWLIMLVVGKLRPYLGA
jgi:hypothetical protein